MADGANMVLVSVREHDRKNIVSALREEANVRHHDIHARRGGFASEENPAIHDNPLARVFRSKTVGIEIHSDFAGAAQRKKHEVVAVDRAGRHETGLVFARDTFRE